LNRFVTTLILIATAARGVQAQPADAGAPPAPDANPPTPPPEPPTTTPTTPAPTEPSAADLAEIEAALGADSKESAAAAPTVVGTPVASSLMPDISLVLDVAAAGFSQQDNLQTGDHDPKVNGFNLQQLEMTLGKAVDPYFRLDANLVFGEGGVEVEEAYATTLALPANLQVRAGKFLTRFGRLNPTHPHAWDFVDQPFAIGRLFGSEGNRGLGAEVSYLTPAPFFLELVGSVTNADGEGSARSFIGAADHPVESPTDLQGTLAAKEFFELSPNWSLATGQSLATGPNGTAGDKRTNIIGVDVYLKYRPITHASDTVVAMQSEWMYRRRQVPDRIATDVSGYAYLTWRFTKRWGVGGRYEYGSGDADDLDPAWTSARHRATAAVTFWPTEFSRLRLQSSVDIPTWLSDPIWATFLAAEFSIGAHAAHKF
jgi:hypothetical protein